MKILRVVYISLLCFLPLFCTNTTQVNISIGNKELHIKSPDKFHEISSAYPEYKKMGEMFTPPSHRFLGLFVTEQDLGYVMKGQPKESLDRYMMLQTIKEIEPQNITHSKFISFKESMKKNIAISIDKTKQKANTEFDKVKSNLSSNYSIDYSVKVGEIYPLGVSLEYDDVLTLSYLSKYNFKVNGNNVEKVVVYGSSLVLIKGKLLVTTVYSMFNSQEDIDWVKIKSKEWVDSILATNI